MNEEIMNKLDDMLTEMAKLDKHLNVMHYNPEAIPAEQAEEVEKLLQALQYARNLAEKIAIICEY